MKCVNLLMAVASAALHVAQHIDLKELTTSWSDFKKSKIPLEEVPVSPAEVPVEVPAST